MAKTNFVELVLACGSWQEAQRVVDHLLGQKLIESAEFLPIKAKRWLKEQAEETRHLKLVMKSLADDFEKIEAEVAKVYGHKNFMLHKSRVAELSHLEISS